MAVVPGFHLLREPFKCKFHSIAPRPHTRTFTFLSATSNFSFFFALRKISPSISGIIIIVVVAAAAAAAATAVVVVVVVVVVIIIIIVILLQFQSIIKQ